MANYSVLKAAVQAVVKTNGNQEITGANMQSTLISIINSLGTGYQFMGVATPSTSPGTPDYNVAYIGGAGTYANFGTSVTVPVGSIGVFKYNGSWTKETITMFAGIDDVPTAGSDNLVKSGGVALTYGKLISSFENESIEYVNGKYVNSSTGVVFDNASGSYAKMKVKAGDKAKIKGYSDNASAKVIFLIPDDGSSFIIVNDYTPSPSNPYIYEYTAPVDGVLVTNCLTQYPHSCIFYSILNIEEEKLLKLESFGSAPSTPVVGTYYYSSSKKIYRITEVSGTTVTKYDVIPFYDGAVYTYNNRTYVWNGSDLVVSFNLADKSTERNKIETSPSSDLLNTQLNGNALTILDTWGNGFIRTNGSTVNPSATEQPTNYRHLLISCVAGDIFTISGEGAEGARLWCFIDANNVPLTRASGAMTADYLTLTAPENAVYLIVNDKNTGKTCYKGKTYETAIQERFEDVPRVIVLKAYKANPVYPYGLQVGDYYWTGDLLYYVTAVRSDGFPTGRTAVTPKDTDIYIYDGGVYVWNGTDIVRNIDEEETYRVKMTAVILEEGTPSSERVVYPVLWGVKYDNSKNVMNGYGKRSHAIPVGWLYYDRENPSDIYYSHGVADNLKKIFTWDSTMANGYSPLKYHPMICRNGDIVCVPYADNYPSASSPLTRTANPIIYKHGDYDNPVEINVVDSTYGIKPVSWFANNAASFVYESNGNDIDCFVFGEYVRPEFEPANVWKVTYPFDTPANWKVVLHTTGTGVGTREVEHFHSVNYDTFTGALYAASGDSATESKIWESKDNGETWTLKFDAGGDETKRTFARMLNWIFTEDGVYYGSDQANTVNRINRGEGNSFSSPTSYNYIDFNTIARIAVLYNSTPNYTAGQTYFTCLIDEPFGLMFLQQRGNTDGKNNAIFYLPLNRKFKLGDIVSWNYYNGSSVTTVTGTIDTLVSETSGTIFLGLGVRATFGKDQTTGATHVNTNRLYLSLHDPKYYIHDAFIMEAMNGVTNPNGFRCDAVNVYQSRAEKRIVCGFGVDRNYNEMAGNKAQSSVDICNLALEVY